ncbi:MAG: DUF89 family protein [Pirellulales bacterium]|nr:DUF89 family protein [Pirellulales bacterium]
MRSFFDCIPCFIRQALDSARFATPDEAVQERVLREALWAGARMDLRQTPPAMAQGIHRAIRLFTSQDDPYREAKDWSNRIALAWYPTLRTWVEDSAKPLETAVRLAIAGNVIDFGVNSRLSEADVHQSITHALSEPLEGDLEEFTAACSEVDQVLYLADNAGEIVFDRLLIEQLPAGKVTVGVRGSPVINDATLADARAAGLHEVAQIIENGSDAPGTLLDDCSEPFRDRFERADLVIAKGQGNYETLSEVDREVYFLLKAKCSVIARHIGCEQGAMVLERSHKLAAKGD